MCIGGPCPAGGHAVAEASRSSCSMSIAGVVIVGDSETLSQLDRR
jgi:hypothetical protein